MLLASCCLCSREVTGGGCGRGGWEQRRGETYRQRRRRRRRRRYVAAGRGGELRRLEGRAEARRRRWDVCKVRHGEELRAGGAGAGVELQAGVDEVKQRGYPPPSCTLAPPSPPPPPVAEAATSSAGSRRWRSRRRLDLWSAAPTHVLPAALVVVVVVVVVGAAGKGPSRRCMRRSWSAGVAPGKRGCPVASSARVQPNAQTSGGGGGWEAGGRMRVLLAGRQELWVGTVCSGR